MVSKQHEFFFCLTRPKASWLPFSVLIRWFQNTDYSHCALKFDVDLHRMVYDSRGFFNNLQNAKYFYKSYDDVKVWKIMVTEEERQKIINRIYERVGTPYGYLQIVGIAWQLIVRKLFNKRVKNPFFNGYNESICSEEFARIMVEDVQTTILDIDGFDSADLLWVEEKLSHNDRFVRMK